MSRSPLPPGRSGSGSGDSGYSGYSGYSSYSASDWTWDGRNLRWREMAAGTSFDATGRTASGHRYGLWGRGALGSFDGALGNGTSLSGETTTLMAGRDVVRPAPEMFGRRGGDMLLGAMIAHTGIDGSFSSSPSSVDGEERKLEGNLVSVVPYGAVDLGKNLRVWGSVGVGSGELRIDGRGSDLEWFMAGAGFRRSLGELGDSPGGLRLRVRGDARYTRAATDLSTSVAGGTEQARVGLGGEWPAMAIGSKWNPEREADEISTWQPKWSLGVRRDGGDAEGGFGIEVGAGIDWRFPGGLEIGFHARGLATHEDENLRDRGASLSVGYDPRPGTARGFSGRFGLDAGLSSSGGTGFLAGEIFPVSSNAATEVEPNWTMEGAYGLRRHRWGLLGSPYLSLSGDRRVEEYRMGYRVAPDGANSPDAPDLEVDAFLGVKAPDNPGEAVEGGVNLRLRW